ncbi:MAG: tetratricopeptide repeat protein [Proteobacteria bacterium]|nr:tetratricopeptide repeat protein [Pseudomonadota bacterium]
MPPPTPREAVPTAEPDAARVAAGPSLQPEATQVGAAVGIDSIDTQLLPEARGSAALAGGLSAAERRPWEERIERLRQEASASTAPRRAALLWHEIGRLHEVQLRAPETALRYYRRSHERSPDLLVNARALSRLLQTRGEHDSADAALQAELALATEDSTRGALHLERALLRLQRRDDADGAVADLLAVLELSKDSKLALTLLAEGLLRRQRSTELGALLDRGGALGQGGPRQAVLLTELGRLYEDALGDAQQAALLYRRAHEADPTNPGPQRGLLRLAHRSHDWRRVVELSIDAAATHPATAAASLLQEAALIAQEQLNDDGLALRCLELIVAIVPTAPGGMLALADHHALRGRWTEAAAALARALLLPLEATIAAELATRLARLHADQLGDVDGAIAILQSLGVATLKHPSACSLLGRLFAQQGRQQDLVELLTAELSLTPEPARQADLLYRIGDIREHRLRDLSGAAQAYEGALARRAAHRPAMRGLSRAAGQLGRNEDRIAAYEQQIATSTDREEKLVLLRRIADAWENALGDPAAALSAYERLLVLEPGHGPALQAVRRIYALGSRWNDLAATLRAEAAQTRDRWRRIGLLTELAEVEEQRRHDDQAALATYREVLALDPSHPPALAGAGRLLQRSGQADELSALHFRQLEVTRDREVRHWLLMKVGRLLADTPERGAEAVAALKEAVALADDPRPATDQLLRLYQRVGDDRPLAALLLKQPPPATEQALGVRERQLAILLQRLDQPSSALDHLRRAVGAGDDEALWLLGVAYGARQDRTGLIGIYQQCEEQAASLHQRLWALHRLAFVLASAPHFLHRAAATYEKLLTFSPRDPIVLQQIEALLPRLDRWADLVATIELASAPAAPADYRAACALIAGVLRQDRLGDLAGAAQSAVAVLDLQPTQPEALELLERFSRESRDPGRLLQALSRKLKSVATAAEQALLLTQIAALYGRSGDLARSRETYQLAADALPEYLPALLGWYRAARGLRDLRDCARALDLQADATQDTARRARCHYQAGRMWQRIPGERARAQRAFRRVLSLDPQHGWAASALRRALRADHRLRDVLELIEQQLQVAVAPRARRELLVEMATLQSEELRDLAGARATLERALTVDPESIALRQSLRQICRRVEDWPALLAVDEALIERTSDPALLHSLLLESATVADRELSDPERAIAAYRQVTALDPHEPTALAGLSRLLTQTGRWTEAAAVTELLAAREPERERAKGHQLHLAHIYAVGFGDLERAIGACRRILALDPGDLRATESLTELLVRQGDAPALAAHLESTLSLHRSRLERDPFRAESYRALLHAFARRGQPVRTEVVHAVLYALNLSAADEVPSSRASIAPSEPPADALTADELEYALLAAPYRGALRALWLAAVPALRKTVAAATRPAQARRLHPRRQPELLHLVSTLAQAVGTKLDACIVRDGSDRLHLLDARTPLLVIGDAAEGLVNAPELRFRIAKLAARARLQHTVAFRLGPPELQRSIVALLSLVSGSFVLPFATDDIEERRPPLAKALGSGGLAHLARCAQELGAQPLDPQRWLLWMEHSEDRIALSLSGDIVAALRALIAEESGPSALSMRTPEPLAELSGPRLRQLLAFAISDEHLALRERLQRR